MSDPTMVRVLHIADVVGTPGRRAVSRLLPGLRRELAIDAVICNAENSADGRGVHFRAARELRDAGCDVLTGGNHTFDHPDISQVLADDDLRAIRPLNLAPDAPGAGSITIRVKGYDLTVLNLIGRVFMNPQDDPFRAADLFLENMPRRTPRPMVVVDFHAEATSEKQAMGWHLSGRVSSVSGTHTHVPTADGRVLPGDTGYVTDLGMVGPRDSVIGMDIDASLRRFLSYRSSRLSVAEGPVAFNAALFEFDPVRGGCRSIMRVDRLDGHG
ncbi:MAG: TIGR00282 family metallophosphoesterase [Thermomicrobiales bacterium]